MEITRVIYTFAVTVCLGKFAESNGLPSDWRFSIANDTFAYSVRHFQRPMVGPRSGTSRTDGTIVEGDIRARPTAANQRPRQGPRFFNAVVGETQTWPRGIVPYVLASDFSWPERELIKEAINDIERRTCVRFLEWPGGASYVDHRDYIRIEKTEGTCSSYVGRMQIGEQDVQLAAGCLKLIGEVQHELLHALGLYHEQSRMDRDQHVYIVRENIFRAQDMDYASQFDKYESNTFGLPYDFESIMHYGHNYFSRSAHLPTIVPRRQQQNRSPVRMGNRDKMTDLDSQKISYLYKCLYISYEKDPSTSTPNSGGVHHSRHVTRHRHTPSSTTRRSVPSRVGATTPMSAAARLSEDDLYRLRKNKYNESKSVWRKFKDAVKNQGDGSRGNPSRRYREVSKYSAVTSPGLTKRPSPGDLRPLFPHLDGGRTTSGARTGETADPLVFILLAGLIHSIFSFTPY
ncbi:putative Dorsal-ventral patterning tolloid-like protein 1 [Hypsibius exemplaris]|uniref:Metalloendopeptidase n=1 Tax=Hypsibius exemplaris TaxID=2072580 RepID=A0A1W0X8B9_HYPEX|nr:putative Dorsal-ventral patterning tolloid-like protein 1 [Hypsibius exemplaris]